MRRFILGAQKHIYKKRSVHMDRKEIVINQLRTM